MLNVKRKEFIMEENKMSEVISEVKNATEDELKEVIVKHFDAVRTQGMKIGASYVAVAVYDAINKNLKNGSKSSLRDYQRAINRVLEIVSVQLVTQQNDSEDSVEEDVNDGTAE
jgi:hypothetical protein